MFSSGQITFGIIFFIAFVIITYFMYRKDKNLHSKNYNGVFWVFLAFIAFILLIILIKKLILAE